MIVYISGPITGIRDNNRRKFLKAEHRIQEALADFFISLEHEGISARGVISGMGRYTPVDRGTQAAIDKQDAMAPYLIFNPNKLAEIVDLKFTGINPRIKPQWSDYMRYCISRLTESDCVFFIKGWDKSKGAMLERQIAEAIGIPCVESVEDLIAMANNCERRTV
jgi:hypothetical protein